MHTWTSLLHRNLDWNQRSSQSPYVRVENLFNELSLECHLGQRLCVHACDTLRIVSLFPFEHHCDRVIGGKPFGFRASHTGTPELLIRKSYRRPRKTSGTPHVNRLVTFPPWRRHDGKHLDNQTHHHGKGLNKAQYFGNHWARHCSRKTVSVILFIRSSWAFFPNDYPCRTLTRKSYLVMRKTSCPYGMVFRHG